ncbi:MAG: family N-acetyltransferase [Phycisphaerales bacterium]|nr:family N-acetyltransferase [Phycisphaerales bacterium]
MAVSGELVLSYRTIQVPADAATAARNHRDACVASFGDDSRCEADVRYLSWLRAKVEEFPEGFVLAYLGDRCVGHLELEVPYGLPTGYVNLYYVLPEFRRQGLGTLMHLYAEKYFRSWEASCIELHVSPTNRAAMQFYRRLGYRAVQLEGAGAPLWRMKRELDLAVREK